MRPQIRKKCQKKKIQDNDNCLNNTVIFQTSKKYVKKNFD